jgi:hypothetical protein
MADRIMNETTSPEQAAHIASLEADNARLRASIETPTLYCCTLTGWRT